MQPREGTPKVDTSRTVIVIAMVALGALALGAIIAVTDNDRLGLFFAMLGAIIASLGATLKADQAAGRLNGSLDRRIHDAVLAANRTRRESDPEA